MTDEQINEDANAVVSSNCILVSVGIGKWSASKPDKALAQAVALSHGADPKAVATTKRLMVGADAELKAMTSKQDAMRTHLYSEHPPFSSANEGAAKKGPRLVLGTKAMDLINTLGVMDAEFKQLRTEFKAVFTQRVQEALVKLGSLADPTLYPDVSEIDDMFTVRIDFDTVPSSTDFSKVNMPVELAVALGDRMAKRQNLALSNAIASTMDEITKYVSAMVKVLVKSSQGEKTRMYETLVTNVQTVTGVLRDCNFASDPELDRLAEMLDGICLHDINVLKASPGVAREIAEKATAIVKHVETMASSAPTPETEPLITTEEVTPVSEEEQVTEPAIDVEFDLDSVMF